MAKTEPSPANASEAIDVGYLWDSEWICWEEMKTTNDVNRRGSEWTWGEIQIFQPVELAQPLLVVTIPNVHIAITTTSGKSIVVLVEADSVHWVNVFDAILLHPMAFEGIFLFLGLSTWVEVFDSHPALYRANDIARLVGEAPQATCLCNRGMSIAAGVWKGGLNKKKPCKTKTSPDISNWTPFSVEPYPYYEDPTPTP